MGKKATPKRHRMMLSNVPAGLRQRCKALAALSGKTLNDWVVKAMVEKAEDEIDIREGLAALANPEGTVTLEQLKTELEARDRACAVAE